MLVQNQVVPVGDLSVITDDFDLSTITTADVVFAVCAIVATFLLAHVVKRWLRRLLNRREEVPALAGDMIAKIVGYFIIALGLVLALEALGFSLGPLGSLLLLAMLAAVIAAQPLLRDLGAGLIIQFRRPFSAGDQVRIDDHEGEIDEVTARALRIKTVDGRRVHIPNRQVLDRPIDNLTAEGARMTTFVAGVAYDTDLDRACEVVIDAMTGTSWARADPAPQAFVEQFADSTINIACRFWHDPRIQDEWAARDEAMRAVKRSFDSNGITIAFPQRVLWSGHPDVMRVGLGSDTSRASKGDTAS